MNKFVIKKKISHNNNTTTTTTNETTVQNLKENVTYTKEEIKAINDSIDYRISMSNLAIKRDYFNYLEKQKQKYVVVEETTDTTTEESPSKEVNAPTEDDGVETAE